MSTPADYDLAIVPPTAVNPPSSGPLAVDGPFGRFAADLLSNELPDLPDQAQNDTVAFVCGRTTLFPEVLRLGVFILSIGVGLAHRMVGRERTLELLQNTSLPFVGELPRLVRSLGFAYIWETWPSTQASGAQP